MTKHAESFVYSCENSVNREPCKICREEHPKKRRKLSPSTEPAESSTSYWGQEAQVIQEENNEEEAENYYSEQDPFTLDFQIKQKKEQEETEVFIKQEQFDDDEPFIKIEEFSDSGTDISDCEQSQFSPSSNSGMIYQVEGSQWCPYDHSSYVASPYSCSSSDDSFEIEELNQYGSGNQYDFATFMDTIGARGIAPFQL
jgi:hypothetical protein